MIKKIGLQQNKTEKEKKRKKTTKPKTYTGIQNRRRILQLRMKPITPETVAPEIYNFNALAISTHTRASH